MWPDLGLHPTDAQAVISLLETARELDQIITRSQIYHTLAHLKERSAIVASIFRQPYLVLLNRNAARFCQDVLSPKGLALRILHQENSGLPLDCLITHITSNFPGLSLSYMETLFQSPEFTLQNNLIFSSKKLAVQAENRKQTIINIFAQSQTPISLVDAYYQLLSLGFNISRSAIIATAYQSDQIVPVRLNQQQLWIHRKFAYLYDSVIIKPEDICQFLNDYFHEKLSLRTTVTIPKKELVQLIQNHFNLTHRQAVSWITKISPIPGDWITLTYQMNRSYFTLHKRDFIRQSIQNLVRELLSDEQWIEKRKLYHLVCQKFPCNIHTFYFYLNEMPDLEHKRSGKTYFCRRQLCYLYN